MMKNRFIRDSINIMIKNWKTTLMIVLFDLVFFLIFLKDWLTDLNRGIYDIFLQSELWIQWVISIPVLLIEVSILILIYSSLKFGTIKFVQMLFKKKKFDLRNYWVFVRINLVALLVIVYTVTIYVLLTTLIFETALGGGIYDQSKLLFALFIGILIGAIMLIHSYTLLNLLHFGFLKEERFKKVVKEAFSRSFKLRTYKIYWPALKIIFVIVILFLVGFIFAVIEWLGYPKYLNFYRSFFTVVSGLMIYLLLMLNRFKFYLLFED